MTDAVLPSGHPEYVELESIADLARQNKILFEANYAGQLTQFRTDVFTKLSRELVMPAGAGWAVYEFDGPATLEHPAAKTDTLVMFTGYRPQLSGLVSPPHIRIIRNEPIIADNQLNYLTHDFVVDEAGDSQYFVSSINSSAIGRRQMTTASLFLVTPQNRLAFSSEVGPWPPTVDMAPQGAVCVPFGHYSNPEDKLQALNVGQELFQAIKEIKPSHGEKLPEQNT